MSESVEIGKGVAESSIAVFQEDAIRRTWHQNGWWFSVIDVVAVLSGSSYANRYWPDLKRKLLAEGGSGQPYEKIVRLKLTAPDGKQRDTDCANTEPLLRIVQSIPSPKAEPFKRWLAQVGYERIREIETPELASARALALYEAKGYPRRGSRSACAQSSMDCCRACSGSWGTAPRRRSTRTTASVITGCWAG